MRLQGLITLNNPFLPLLICWLAAGDNGRAEVSCDITGRLALAQFHEGNWNTNLYAVRVSWDGPHWRISVEGGETHQRTFCDGNEVIWVAYYPQNSTNGPMNTSMLRVFPGARPVDVRIEEHIWMALFSRPLFASARLPMRDVGLCINGAAIFTEVQVGSTDASPRKARWHNQQSDAFTNVTRVEGEFSWVGSTNLGNVEVPVRSELQMSLRPPQLHTTVPASWSEFVITEIGPLKEPSPYQPKLEGRSVVYDYRSGDVSARWPLTYDIRDGKLPAVNSARLTEVERIAKLRIREKVPKGRVIGVWLGLALVSTAVFLPAIFVKQKQKQTESKELKSSE